MNQHIRLLEIQSFGRVALRWHEPSERISLAPREEAFLIYLAYQGEVIARAQLCDFLWPNEPTSRARGNLRKLLTDVRKSMNGAVSSDREYVWLTEQPYWFDVHLFQRLTHSISDSVNRTKSITEREIIQLHEAIQLYVGDFLANFKTPQSHSFTTWLEQEQRRWQQRATTALTFLIEHAILTTQLAKATAYTRHLLEIDPYHEHGHGQLMRLLANQQQAADALEHYVYYASLVQNELGSGAEEELTALYQQIRLGGVPPLHTELATDNVVTAPPSTPIGQPIPKPVTQLIGRSQLLSQLHQYLQNPATRLITLVGLGGIGKSRVALALADMVKADYNNAVNYISLDQWLSAFMSERISAEQSYTVLTKATAETLSITRDAADLQLDQHISDQLQNQRRLLLFDSFENVVEGAPFLLKLLQEAPSIKILVTSREVLQIKGEVVVKVEGLPWAFLHATKGHDASPDSIETSRLPSAVELFTNTAQRHQPELLFSEENLQQIGQICALVDGNPLAIELAAGLVAHYSYQELIALVGDNLQSLQAIGRGRHQRHGSIHEVLEESWCHLSPAEQIALTRLSLLPRHFHRTNAVQQEGISPSMLIGLTAKSMLQPTGQGSYQLPHMVQRFATQKRQQNGETPVFSKVEETIPLP